MSPLKILQIRQRVVKRAADVPHRVKRHFDILDDRVTLALRIEGFFACSFNRVLQQIEEAADTRCLSLFDQLLASGRDQQCLHVAARLSQIEQFPPVGPAAHLNNALRLVEPNIR